jgi:threonine/homoserine/homoserine lactone efflux protein
VNLAVLALTALPIVVSPGVSFAITVRAAIAGDQAAPLKVWAGTSFGIVVIATITVATGVGHLLAEDETARTTFGVLGGTVLVCFGVASLIRALGPATNGEQPGRSRRQLVVLAFVAVITNVKALSVYALVVPTLQRTDLSGSALVFTFAAVHIAMLFFWLTLLGAAVRAVPIIGTSERIRTALLLFAALALLGLGSVTLINAIR